MCGCCADARWTASLVCNCEGCHKGVPVTVEPHTPEEWERERRMWRNETQRLWQEGRSLDSRPRTFRLVRDVDVSGVSGVGPVAEGVEFSDGVVSLRWIVPPGVPGHGYPTSVVFHDNGMDSVAAIHGHNGATRIEWL